MDRANRRLLGLARKGLNLQLGVLHYHPTTKRCPKAIMSMMLDQALILVRQAIAWAGCLQPNDTTLKIERRLVYIEDVLSLKVNYLNVISINKVHTSATIHLLPKLILIP